MNDNVFLQGPLQDRYLLISNRPGHAVKLFVRNTFIGSCFHYNWAMPCITINENQSIYEELCNNKCKFCKTIFIF